ncbi:MAG: pyrimidine/purine nucleoside phosphorylase [Myxococcales bacterium]|nr:MAG: pyrimidine/purine nucleoside phosphorylase [Myxococcales bacterium]
MLSHNNYFDGAVQSVGFERNGRRCSVGVVDKGSFHFGTEAAERMTVVSGELWVQGADGQWRHYPAGTSFEIAANGGFDVRADAPAAYLCEYL